MAVCWAGVTSGRALASGYGDGRDSGGEGRAVGRYVDAEGQAADDAEPRDPFGEFADQTVAHRLPVGSCAACADQRETSCREGLGVTFYV